MPDLGNITYQILLATLALSSIGVADMFYRWKNGKAYRELRKLKNPSVLTEKILNECGPLLKPCWWHWALLVVFVLSLGRLIIDSH
jgi:hypothetical protein